MSGRRIVLVTALAVAVASGCGGDSDEDKANQVAEDYIAALNAKNDSRACELQTASSQNKGGGCTLHSELQVIPRSPKFGAVEIAGEFARVLVTGPNGSVTLELTKEDGGWKIAEYQGQAAQ